MVKARFIPFLALGIGVLGSSPLFGASAAVNGLTIANNTPRFTATSKNLGTVNSSTALEVSIWLKPHNKADLDAVAKEMYDPTSRNYRHWLTKAEFMQRYGPTKAEAKTVEEFFTAHGMKIVKSDPDNFYVRASGTAAQVTSAFHTKLNNYEVEGKTLRANASDPVVTGEAAALVASVAGLDTAGFTHPVVSRTTTRLPLAANGTVDAATAPRTATTAALSSACFPGTETESFTSEGSLPTATYTGNAYTKSTLGCGYTPSQIRAAYNLTPLYAKKYDGTGQTIVILDWCGSPTITSDANAFSAKFGLPKLTSSNFKIIYTPSPSYCEAPDAEINLDVEWSHAIAPGAAIDLVVPPSNTFQDINQALYYAVNYQLGNVISNSYGSEEYFTSPATLIQEDLILETAAVLGISANYSTGDYGDFTFDDPQDNPASVSAPADSPWATAVGGVSLALNSDNSIAWQSGWGTNENVLAEEGYVNDDPSTTGYFNFGSGGGPSAFYAKPSYQSKLKGTTRQLPDISWLGDPFTGAYIAISEPFTQPELTYTVIGGTSLSTPMFSGLWAIANQIAGQPLGQAAPYLYSMPASTITDILPYASKTNVTGKVKTTSGTTSYSANSLVEPLEGTSQYVSTIWNYPLLEDTALILTFGTDSGLKTTKGWDNVTGLGVPNGAAFAEYFKP